jgi:hypothetical protein
MSNKQQTPVEQIKKHLELPHRETIISTNTLQTKHFDNQKLEIMSNKQQTAIEQFAIALYENGFLQGDGDGIQEIVEIFKEMEKERIIEFAELCWKNLLRSDVIMRPRDVYNETYGGNK